MCVRIKKCLPLYVFYAILITLDRNMTVFAFARFIFAYVQPHNSFSIFAYATFEFAFAPKIYSYFIQEVIYGYLRPDRIAA